MSLPLIVREEAEADIESAFGWYEEQRPGLGAEFIASVDEAIEDIQEQPGLHPRIYRSARRVLLNRFPYAVYYLLQNDMIEVVACMHFRRHPRRWRERLR